MSHLIGAFLEMMSAERGAAKNTIDAYRRDLSDYAGYVAGKQQTLLNVDRDTVNAFLDRLKQDGLSAASSARSSASASGSTCRPRARCGRRSSPSISAT